jgi:hypothetical protein
MPLFFYFYFSLAFIATLGIYYRKNSALMLSYCVLMFGCAISVISSLVIYKEHYFIGMLIVPLIVFNLAVIFYMASNQSYYKNN